jgi:hypothetical protein
MDAMELEAIGGFDEEPGYKEPAEVWAASENGGAPGGMCPFGYAAMLFMAARAGLLSLILVANCFNAAIGPML